MLSGMMCQKEITQLKFHLQDLRAASMCVCDAVGGAKGFRHVCQVAQHALSSPADSVQKVLQVCQKLL